MRALGGSVGGVVGGLPGAPPPPAPLASPADVESAMADLDAAAGGELGELFEYKLKQPVTIRRNQSAMVPVVQHDVAVERVSLWSAARGVAQPLRAVWLTNDTGLTLDGGSLTLVEGGAFAGEGLVEAIKPGEKRFVSYAVDLGVRVTAAPQEAGRRVSRVRIAASVMTQSVEERASMLYTIRNDDATPRDVVIEHPARAGWSADRRRQAGRVVGDRASFQGRGGAEVDRDADGRRSAADRPARLRLEHLGRSDRADPAAGATSPPASSRSCGRWRPSRARWARSQRRIVRSPGARSGGSAKTRAASARTSRRSRAATPRRRLTERYTRQLSTQEDRLEVLRKEIDAAAAEQRREAAGAVAAGCGALGRRRVAVRSEPTSVFAACRISPRTWPRRWPGRCPARGSTSACRHACSTARCRRLPAAIDRRPC